MLTLLRVIFYGLAILAVIGAVIDMTDNATLFVLAYLACALILAFLGAVCGALQEVIAVARAREMAQHAPASIAHTS